MRSKAPGSSNTFFALADQAIVSGANFLTNLLLARWMGLEAFGIFWMVWLLVLLGAAVQSAVVISPMQHLLSRAVTSRRQRESTAMWLVTAFLVTAGLLVFYPLSTLLQPYLSQVPVLLVVLNALAYNWVDYLRRLFFVSQQPQRALGLDIGSYGLQLLLAIGATFLLAPTATSALIIMLGSNILPGLWFLFRYIKPPHAKGWQKTVNTYAQSGKWLLAAALLQWFSGNWFLVLAGSIMSAAAAGAIRMVQQILGLTHILFLALENIVPAGASAMLYQKGETAMWRYLKEKTLLTGSLVVPFLLLLFCFPTQIMQLVYGHDQLIPVELVRWFAAMYLLVFAGTMMRFAIRALEKTRVVFLSSIISTAFSLTFGQYLVQDWGLSGALAGMFFAQVITLILFIYTFVARHENYTPRIRQSQS